MTTLSNSLLRRQNKKNSHLAINAQYYIKFRRHSPRESAQIACDQERGGLFDSASLHGNCVSQNRLMQSKRQERRGGGGGGGNWTYNRDSVV